MGSCVVAAKEGRTHHTTQSPSLTVKQYYQSRELNCIEILEDWSDLY